MTSADMISRKTLSKKVESNQQCTNEGDGSDIPKETSDDITQQKRDNSPANENDQIETSESPVESEKGDVQDNQSHKNDKDHDNKDDHSTRYKSESGADLEKHTEETKESQIETETENATEEKLKGTK